MKNLSRRARKSLSWREPVSPRSIFERDNFRCYLCGMCCVPVENGDQVSSSATIDHIVPLALGGAHASWNIATACWECNSEKSNRADMVDLRHVLDFLARDGSRRRNKKKKIARQVKSRKKLGVFCLIDVRGVCRRGCRSTNECGAYLHHDNEEKK